MKKNAVSLLAAFLLVVSHIGCGNAASGNPQADPDESAVSEDADFGGTVLRDCAKGCLADSGMQAEEIDELIAYLTQS